MVSHTKQNVGGWPGLNNSITTSIAGWRCCCVLFFVLEAYVFSFCEICGFKGFNEKNEVNRRKVDFAAVLPH